MATTIDQHFITEFGSNWEHQVQQRTARLEGLALVDTITGKEKTYNQISSVTDEKITGRLQDTAGDELNLEKRWVRLEKYHKTTLFDEWDEQMLGTVVLPTSETVGAHAMAYNRRCDSVLISALEGTAYSGETGVTSNTLGASQQVAVNLSGSSEGMTVGKLIEAKSILGKNEAWESQSPESGDELIMVVSQQQLDDMLAITQVTSSDYNSIRALVNGEVDTFMGFRFVRSQQLTLASATDVRTCIAYVKSAARITKGEKRTHMDIRSDKNHALQIRTPYMLGAARMEEEKVVLVYCDESP